ncbi:enolase C-terminal domain-like protein, partial [Phytoactinopolyspora endophytica]|uniref:enolase C-terminal domain-like protein n=1 Tax=Phytoactinopolyspora endophytica TaxID=1642495 RepID=UPI0023EA6D55
AAELQASGVQRFKLHLGQGVDRDLATFDAVADAVPDASIALDAHGVYDISAAVRLGRGLDERTAWFFESPIAADDVAGHAELAAAIDTPVAAGEALRHRFEAADWISRRSADILQPDIGRTGITEGMAIGTLANAAYRPVMPHQSAALGPAVAASLH